MTGRRVADGSAEPGRADASARAPPIPAGALNSLELRKMIHDPRWLAQAPRVFQGRTVVTDNRFPSGSDSQDLGNNPGSPASSTAMSVGVASTFFGDSISSRRESTSSLPSFGPCSTVRTGSSIGTSRADSGFEQYRLEEDDDGALVAPAAQADRSLACLFQFMGCWYQSSDVSEWDGHCQWHLHGHLPKNVRCPFGCAWKISAGTGEEAWSSYIRHILSRHRQECSGTAPAPRPEKDLLAHMWRNRVISDMAYQELTMSGKLEVGRSFTVSGGSSQDRRRERRGR